MMMLLVFFEYIKLNNLPMISAKAPKIAKSNHSIALPIAIAANFNAKALLSELLLLFGFVCICNDDTDLVMLQIL